MVTDQGVTLVVAHADVFGIPCIRITCSCGWWSPWWPERYAEARTRLAHSAARHVRDLHQLPKLGELTDELTPPEDMHGQ